MGRERRQIRQAAFPVLAQRAAPAEMEKQGRIRERQLMGIELERDHAAPQQVLVVGAVARARAKPGGACVIGEVLHLAGAQAGGFEQLIDPLRQPLSPRTGDRNQEPAAVPR